MKSIFSLCTLLISGCLEFPITVHLDQTWTQEERRIIRDAFDDWQDATGGLAKAIIGEDRPHSEWYPLRDYAYEAIGPTTIWKLSTIEKEEYNLQYGHEDNPAFTWFRLTMVLVMDEISQDDLSWVVRHEIGHLYGLHHVDQDEPKTLMQYATPFADCIDSRTVDKFCELYSCPAAAHSTCEDIF